jgi:NADH-quinone oxidoreductase subunit F
MPELRRLTENCGAIAPGDISEYQAKGGFQALAKAKKMQPAEVIGEVKDSGLRGRGGAGFPCGVKWEMARQADSAEKFLICNADEGEVGTFKDRYLLEGDPFKVIEGIAIAAYAIGAQRAIIYLRQEYHRLVEGLQAAIEAAAGKGFTEGVEISIFEGAGAYICGEESALMNSLQGLRGEPRYKPPFPPAQGLWDQPTIINNVETLANVPHIIAEGASSYAGSGTEQSKGSKLFCVSGDVARPGVYELAFGSSLRELVEGMAGAEDVAWVQVGGSTGAVIPAGELDTPLGYETSVGSGAVMVFNSQRDVVAFLLGTLEFLAEESCGKCTPCREGTEVMVEILGRIMAGEGSQMDLAALEDLSQAMGAAALCGLGQSVPTPVSGVLRHFRDKVEQRISQGVFLKSLKAAPANPQ